MWGNAGAVSSASKVLYKPLSIVASVAGGLLAGKIFTEVWQRISEQSRLAGEVARNISAETDRLREEFRSWQSGVTVTG